MGDVVEADQARMDRVDEQGPDFGVVGRSRGSVHQRPRPARDAQWTLGDEALVQQIASRDPNPADRSGRAMRWHEDVHRWRDAAAWQAVQRRRRRPRKPRIRPSQKQSSDEALLRRRQSAVKQQDPRKDHPPPSSDGPPDLRCGYPAVEQLPARGKAQLAVDQLGGKRRQHAPSVEDAVPPRGGQLRSCGWRDDSATPCEDGVTAALVPARLLWEQHESRCDSRYDTGLHVLPVAPCLVLPLFHHVEKKDEP